MRRVLAVMLALGLASIPFLETASAQPLGVSFYQDQQDTGSYQPYEPDQLDNLLAPVALYPDPLLSQVLVAATFVDQVDEAARYVRANGQYGIDDQNWDVSVKAVAHYPTVIEMMADKIDWTTSVGQAYVYQSTDVATSIQRLRHMARNVGNLASTPQQEVIVNGDYIAIDPYQPQYIYVPVYDPYICYYRRPYWGLAITFGAGFAVGAWLNRDWDWGGRGIYYHGWGGDRDWDRGWHGGWVERCRPNVRITNVYVNNHYNTVIVNRTVINRTVNVNNINRYNAVHKDVTYGNVQVNNTRVSNRGGGGDYRGGGPRNDSFNNNRPVGANNKIIDRNIDRGNPRIDQYRGHDNNFRNDRPNPTQQNRPANSTNNDFRNQNRNPGQPQNRPVTPNNDLRYQNRNQGQPQGRPAYQPPVNGGPHTFNRNENNFDPRVSSQRGQASRQQAESPRPAPQPRAESRPAPHGGGGGERKKP
jgi:hypothetical protein